MNTKARITAERLRDLLSYDPQTGEFRWVRPTTRSVRVGDVAGSSGPGYVGIFIDGYRYYAHRLAWLHMTGAFPRQQLDHINGDRRDNRFSNLRECSGSQNQQNRAANKANRTGLVGVCLHKRSGKFQAQITVQGKTRALGMFADPQAAHAAYLDAKRAAHKFQPTPQNKAAA